MAVAGLNTTLTDPASPSSAGDYRPVRSRAVAWSVVGVVFVECLYALWTASRGYFWQDDFIDLQALRQLGFDGRLFEQPVFGHFIPGFNFVDYLISLIVPYPWWLIVLLEVLLFGLSLFLLDHLLTILFGPSWLGVALVAIAGASFSLVPSLVWWATALEYLVAIPATLLACIFHVRYLRTGRVRYAAFGGGAPSDRVCFLRRPVRVRLIHRPHDRVDLACCARPAGSETDLGSPLASLGVLRHPGRARARLALHPPRGLHNRGLGQHRPDCSASSDWRGPNPSFL